MVAVLSSLSLKRIERLLGSLFEQSELELVRFKNQPSTGSPGIPDAEIVASCRLLVETKIRPGSASRDQLKRHLNRLDASSEMTRLLLVLTPDRRAPDIISEINDERLVWTSFESLDQAIEELLGDPREVVSEREAFLLRELQAMLLEEGLVGSAKDVVVVPARYAWPFYQRYQAYVCQPRRPFQSVKYIAFYSGNQIHPVVPSVLETYDEVVFEEGRYTAELGSLIGRCLQEPMIARKEQGQTYKVMLLTAPDDPRTMQLSSPIVNDLRSDSGRTIAFTQNQRYVASESLLAASRTSELAAG